MGRGSQGQRLGICVKYVAVFVSFLLVLEKEFSFVLVKHTAVVVYVPPSLFVSSTLKGLDVRTVLVSFLLVLSLVE